MKLFPPFLSWFIILIHLGGDTLKIKTLRDNVKTLNKKGTVLEVSEEVGKSLIEFGVAEEVKPAPKKTNTKKKAENKEGE